MQRSRRGLAKEAAITNRTEIKALTSLRGIAALLVVIFHLRTEFGTTVKLDAGTAFFANGFLWVDFFFVLSGFVIALVYGDEFRERIAASDCVQFLIRRLARVYPLHFFTLMCFIPTEVAKYFVQTSAYPAFSRNTIPAFIANIFLVQAWGMFPDVTWNRPSWSISVEWFSYLLFPVTAFLLWRVRSVYLLSILAIPLLMALGLSGAMSAITGIAVFRCLFTFILGMLVYRFYAKGPVYLTRIMGSDASLFASLVLTILAMHFNVMPVAVLVLFVWVVAAASLNKGRVGRAISIRPLYLLGAISYSIYLMQGLIVRLWQGLFQIVWHEHIASADAYIVLAILLCATIAVSTLSYRFIEKPGRRMLSKFSYRKPKSA